MIYYLLTIFLLAMASHDCAANTTTSVPPTNCTFSSWVDWPSKTFVQNDSKCLKGKYRAITATGPGEAENCTGAKTFEQEELQCSHLSIKCNYGAWETSNLTVANGDVCNRINHRTKTFSSAASAQCDEKLIDVGGDVDCPYCKYDWEHPEESRCQRDMLDVDSSCYRNKTFVDVFVGRINASFCPNITIKEVCNTTEPDCRIGCTYHHWVSWDYVTRLDQFWKIRTRNFSHLTTYQTTDDACFQTTLQENQLTFDEARLVAHFASDCVYENKWHVTRNCSRSDSVTDKSSCFKTLTLKVKKQAFGRDPCVMMEMNVTCESPKCLAYGNTACIYDWKTPVVSDCNWNGLAVTSGCYRNKTYVLAQPEDHSTNCSNITVEEACQGSDACRPLGCKYGTWSSWTYKLDNSGVWKAKNRIFVGYEISNGTCNETTYDQQKLTAQELEVFLEFQRKLLLTQYNTTKLELRTGIAEVRLFYANSISGEAAQSGVDPKFDRIIKEKCVEYGKAVVTDLHVNNMTLNASNTAYLVVHIKIWKPDDERSKRSPVTSALENRIQQKFQQNPQDIGFNNFETAKLIGIPEESEEYGFAGWKIGIISLAGACFLAFIATVIYCILRRKRDNSNVLFPESTKTDIPAAEKAATIPTIPQPVDSAQKSGEGDTMDTLDNAAKREDEVPSKYERMMSVGPRSENMIDEQSKVSTKIPKAVLNNELATTATELSITLKDPPQDQSVSQNITHDASSQLITNDTHSNTVQSEGGKHSDAKAVKNSEAQSNVYQSDVINDQAQISKQMTSKKKTR